MKITDGITTEIAIVDNETVESLIYVIRGQKVMLDADLAKIYGYTTKAFNQQVKRNIEKFDGDFMFQLTEQEIKEISRPQNVTLNKNEDFRFQLTDEETKEISRSKNSTLNEKKGRGHNIKYNPYAFTEQGLYMLMTVLKGELAVEQSKALIRIFKGMKDYITENRVLIGTDDIARLAIQTSDNTAAIVKINDEMLRKSDLPKIFKNFASTDTGKEFLIMNGQLTEADVAYQGIYAKAKRSIYIVDDYIGIKSIMHLRNIKPLVDVIVFSDNRQSHLKLTDVNDFNTEFPNIQIKFKKTNNTVHDRYIILDYGKRSEKVYHCGASSKDAGRKATSITEIRDKSIYGQFVDGLLQNQTLVIT